MKIDWNATLSEEDLGLILGSGSIGNLNVPLGTGMGYFIANISYDKADNVEPKEERSDGGVFFSHKEEVDEDGATVYRNVENKGKWSCEISDASGHYGNVKEI